MQQQSYQSGRVHILKHFKHIESFLMLTTLFVQMTPSLMLTHTHTHTHSSWLADVCMHALRPTSIHSHTVD